jgi:anti-sigma B factor antagonist
MAITVSASDSGQVVLTVTGDVDVSTADELRDTGLAALDSEGCRTLVVEMGETEFLDSTGLGALVHLRNSSESSGRKLILRNPTRQAERVLSLTALDTVFTIERT